MINIFKNYLKKIYYFPFKKKTLFYENLISDLESKLTENKKIIDDLNKKISKKNTTDRFLNLKASKLIVVYLKDLNNRFSKLTDKYYSDKSTLLKTKKFPWECHSYEYFYSTLFNQNDSLKIFELGLGTNNISIKSNMTNNGRPGASLRVFSKYYKNSYVYGGDIDKNILFNTDKIKTFNVDQTNQKSIKKLWENFDQGFFDLIIDDGLHEFSASKSFFINSINYIKKGGYYVIEDVINKDILKYFNYYSKVQGFSFQILSFQNQKKNYDDTLIVLKKN